MTLTSMPPRLAGSRTVSATMGSSVVNATPNKLAQLPGLQNSVDWRSAALRAVRMTLSVMAAFRFTDALLLCPFQLAVTVAVWSLLTVPAVALKVPLLDPALIVMLAGTLNRPRLLDKATVAVLVAALVSVTVQVALCPVPKVPGVQLNPDNCAGATRFKVNVCVTPPALAVITAV